MSIKLIIPEVDETPPFTIQAVQIGEEVHLRIEDNKHSFVVCKKDETGDPVVGIVDVDTGCRMWHNIKCLNWKH